MPRLEKNSVTTQLWRKTPEFTLKKNKKITKKNTQT